MYVRPPLKLAICLFIVHRKHNHNHNHPPWQPHFSPIRHHRRSSHPVRFVSVPPHCTATTAAGHRTTMLLGSVHPSNLFSPPPLTSQPQSSNPFHPSPSNDVYYRTAMSHTSAATAWHGSFYWSIEVRWVLFTLILSVHTGTYPRWFRKLKQWEINQQNDINWAFLDLKRQRQPEVVDWCVNHHHTPQVELHVGRCTCR